MVFRVFRVFRGFRGCLGCLGLMTFWKVKKGDQGGGPKKAKIQYGAKPDIFKITWPLPCPRLGRSLTSVSVCTRCLIKSMVHLIAEPVKWPSSSVRKVHVELLRFEESSTSAAVQRLDSIPSCCTLPDAGFTNRLLLSTRSQSAVFPHVQPMSFDFSLFQSSHEHQRKKSRAGLTEKSAKVTSLTSSTRVDWSCFGAKERSNIGGTPSRANVSNPT